MDDHRYYLMLRRGLSMHRDDCPLIGQPHQRFWKGPFAYHEALNHADRVPATFIPRVCEGDCNADDMAWFLDLERDEGWPAKEP